MEKSKSILLPKLLEAYETGRVDFTEWEEEFLDNLDSLSDDAELSSGRVNVLIKMENKYGI